MSFDPREIANYALDQADKLAYHITNLALNKILYFSHGWHLALEGTPLLDATFEAWQYGPVVPILYHQFKTWGDRPIRSRATKIDLVTGCDVLCIYDEDQLPLEFLDKMIGFYGAKSGVTLSMMSHEPGAPWAIVRADSPMPGMLIKDDMIRRYFSSRLDRSVRRDAH